MGYFVPVESIYLMSERDIFAVFYSQYLIRHSLVKAISVRRKLGKSFSTSTISTMGGRVKVMLKMDFFMLVS